MSESQKFRHMSAAFFPYFGACQNMVDVRRRRNPPTTKEGRHRSVETTTQRKASLYVKGFRTLRRAFSVTFDSPKVTQSAPSCKKSPSCRQLLKLFHKLTLSHDQNPLDTHIHSVAFFAEPWRLSYTKNLNKKRYKLLSQPANSPAIRPIHLSLTKH